MDEKPVVNEGELLYRRLMAKAAADQGFRKALIADPRTALERELGVPLPKKLSIRAAEKASGEVVLSFKIEESGELTDEELSRVAGGLTLALPASTSSTGTEQPHNSDYNILISIVKTMNEESSIFNKSMM